MDYKITKKRDSLEISYQDKLKAFLKAIGREEPLPDGNPLLKPLDFFFLQEDAFFSNTPFVLRSDDAASTTKHITEETFPDFLCSVCGLPDSEDAQDQRKALYRTLRKYVLSECTNRSLLSRIIQINPIREQQLFMDKYSVCLDALITKLGYSLSWLSPQSPLRSPENHFYCKDDKLFSVESFPESDVYISGEEIILNQINMNVFPRYLRLVCNIDTPQNCSKECDDLYKALKELITRKKSPKDLALNNILACCPELHAYLYRQNDSPYIYRTEDDQLLLDTGSSSPGSFLCPTRPGAPRFQSLLNADFSQFFKDREQQMPGKLLTRYLSHLGDSTAPACCKSFSGCAVYDQEGHLLQAYMPHCSYMVSDGSNLPLLEQKTIPENAILFQNPDAPSTVQQVTFDPAQKVFQSKSIPIFSITIPVTQPAPFSVGQTPTQSGPPTFHGIYNQKLMPEALPKHLPEITEGCRAFFRIVCGGFTAAYDDLARLFAKITMTGLSGLTVIRSQHQIGLVKKTLAQVFYDCVIDQGEDSSLLGIPDFIIPARRFDQKYIDISLSNVIKHDALRKSYLGQLEGRSLRFLKDTVPAGEISTRANKRSAFMHTLKGGENWIKSEFLPNQLYRNHLYYVCVTDQKKSVAYFKDSLKANILDLSAKESDEPEDIEYKEEDIVWFRTSFLLHGLKLLTLAQAEPTDPNPDTAPPEAVDVPSQEAAPAPEPPQDEPESAEAPVKEEPAPAPDEDSVQPNDVPASASEDNNQPEDKDVIATEDGSGTPEDEDDIATEDGSGTPKDEDDIATEDGFGTPEEADPAVADNDHDLPQNTPDNIICPLPNETGTGCQPSAQDSVSDNSSEKETPSPEAPKVPEAPDKPRQDTEETGSIDEDFFMEFFGLTDVDTPVSTPTKPDPEPAAETTETQPSEPEKAEAQIPEPEKADDEQSDDETITQPEPALPPKEELLTQFLTSELILSEDSFVPKEELYKLYKSYAKKTHVKKSLILVEKDFYSLIRDKILSLVYPSGQVTWKRKHISRKEYPYGVYGLTPVAADQTKK